VKGSEKGGREIRCFITWLNSRVDQRSIVKKGVLSQYTYLDGRGERCGRGIRRESLSFKFCGEHTEHFYKIVIDERWMV